MPIYEYECQDCQHHFDILQKIHDDLIVECPDCHHDTLVRLVSAAGFQLKGTGWYVTDFKNKDKPTKSTQEGASDAKSASESKANKPDSKSETTSGKKQIKSTE